MTIRNPVTGDDIDETSAATLAPGVILGVANINETNSTQYSWCEFEFKGKKKKVRATFCVFTSAGCQGAVHAY